MKDIEHLLRKEAIDIENEKNTLVGNIKDIQTKLDALPSPDETRGVISNLVTNWGYMTREEKRRLSKILIKKIIVWNDKIKIFFNDEQMPAEIVKKA